MPLVQRLANLSRWAIGLLAAGIVLFSFAWVAHRSLFRTSVKPGQIELTLVHWGDDDEDQIVQTLVGEFERDHPGIRVRRVNPGQAAAVNTKLQTMFASGDPPDAMQLGYEKIADWASKDLLMPLDERIAGDAQAGHPAALRLDDYYANVMDCFRFDGQRVGRGPLYGLAKDFTTAGFYYNKDLFRKAGVAPPGDDWTWEEFIAAARKIAKLPGCYGAEFVTWEAMVRLYIWTEGGDFANETFDTFRVREPETLAALGRLRSWFHDEDRTFFSAKTQLETGEDLFLSGKVGMSGPLGRWKVPTFRLIRDFDWDFAPLPRGRQPANGIFTSAWAIARETRHPNETWELVRFLIGRRGQELSCGPGLAIPTHRSVAEGPLFVDPAQKPGRDDAYLMMIPHARTIDWPADPRYLESLRITLEELLKTGKLSADAAMSKVEREWSRFRDEQPVRSPMPWGWIAAAVLLPALLVAVVVRVGLKNHPLSAAGRREELAGYAMISPWLIGFAVFTAFPVALSLLLAFCDWSGMSTLAHAKWVGWANFGGLLRDQRFQKSLYVTTWYAALAVPLGQLAALGAALLMNTEIRGIGFFRSAWYLPSVLAGVGVAVLWKYVFDDETGLLNGVLRSLYEPTRAGLSTLGLDLAAWQNVGWLEKDAERFGVPAFVIISLWSVGGAMMVYLAGLKGIPAELYEAASIDGAKTWRRFTNVTLPMLSPVIFFNTIIAVIASFQVFTQAYVMTGGGPGDATRFYVMRLYNQAFDNHQMGSASAMAWLLLLLILVLTLLVMWGSRRFVYYEALKS